MEGNHMKLDRDQVLHIAELAKLGITEEETSLFSEQLSAILDYFTMLDELDTSALPPTAMVIEQVNVLREDRAGQSLPVARLLEAAPHTDEQYVAVKAILDQG
jgi:aspartyl-tRNA(Asn)/glutamyl-tRNA(Gln) amidotransferase subunit C